MKCNKYIKLHTNSILLGNVTIKISTIKPGICGVHKMHMCQTLPDITGLQDYTQSRTNVRDITRNTISINNCKTKAQLYGDCAQPRTNVRQVTRDTLSTKQLQGQSKTKWLTNRVTTHFTRSSCLISNIQNPTYKGREKETRKEVPNNQRRQTYQCHAHRNFKSKNTQRNL
jgi:hypothetical protein